MLIFLRARPNQSSMRSALIALSIACLLSACGLKGPLYLPDQKPAAKPVESSVAPANEKKPSGPATP
jgi:predicted small lipoprotein YifL